MQTLWKKNPKENLGYLTTNLWVSYTYLRTIPILSQFTESKPFPSFGVNPLRVTLVKTTVNGSATKEATLKDSL